MRLDALPRVTRREALKIVRKIDDARHRYGKKKFTDEEYTLIIDGFWKELETLGITKDEALTDELFFKVIDERANKKRYYADNKLRAQS